ncbi:CoA transferase [Alicyclobacillus cycloheptanicus]|uniref:Crotonobetainyl-CoA:carnitine CoA-transferase CaiB-like acyl-CoA transferase n=1 Tax=Alicyclobacillus cycloheptanicus TaxID=1457 RepID=A0ABT9XIH2_9BACL|nr:CoA transferase [Alicyclobacillus cycloheptanicus]MDQ0189920.1 crotonobetainyl-CoA:carnitine CoA-transferase CaiB-like acyl-CoA transferase [Alicyclobacillus cycloheptanicus]WDM02177.1 CoA transferase [Alicyclobacillus cycloheptanicus]
MAILSTIRVLDLSRILSGPYITMCLGDMGADVIKIEQPGKGDDTRHWGPPFYGEDSTYYLAINRNKRSVTLDLKQAEGRRVLEQLVSSADVVVENFRNDTRDRLCLDYDSLRQLNPSLIMLHISAFGEAGPDRNKPGYDVLAQAMGGVMSLTGDEDGPPMKAGFAVADLGAAMFGLAGILGALFHRSQTGQGQYLTTSLYESQLAFHINWATNYFATGEVPRRIGSAHPNLAPYQPFATSDGNIVLAVGNDALWQKLCSVLSRPDLADDSRFKTNADRVRNQKELGAILSDIFRERSTQYWCGLLDKAGVPAGPIWNLEDIYVNNPQTEALEMVQEVMHPVAGRLKQIRFPVNFSKEAARIQTPPPLLGEHTEEVLTELGFSDTKIHELRVKGVI